MRQRLSKKRLVMIAIAVLIVTISVFLVPNRKHPVSFFYWKQSYSLNKEQQQLLKKCAAEELFVKFFDVAINPSSGAVEPVSIISFKERPGLAVIPCVFIQNNVFKFEKNPGKLAEKVLGLIQQIAKKNQLSVKEIQLDCDWTPSTQKAYFGFLEAIQRFEPKLTVTSTIRLHQIKYQAETGVPPVKKGVLMCYNMDDLDVFNTENSIISTETLNKYISPSTTYPIELDLALPIYQWGLVFRLGKLTLIANDISIEQLKGPNYSRIKPQLFKVRKNGYLNNSYVCKGDLIRLENATPATLESIAASFNESKLTFNRLILFHLSQEHFTQFNETNIQKIRHLIP